MNTVSSTNCVTGVQEKKKGWGPEIKKKKIMYMYTHSCVCVYIEIAGTFSSLMNTIKTHIHESQQIPSRKKHK